MKRKRPNWYSSHYRGYYDYKTGKKIIKHRKPLRCPYCGKEMNFDTPIFYESHQSDWYWYCTECGLRLPNESNFPKERLDEIRKKYREYLEKEMQEAKVKFERVKKLYNSYSRYFTPEEKRERLIETIEEHGVKVKEIPE